jgi:hypothetical protein
MQDADVIYDNRKSVYFKTNTFSNYIKKEVFSEFIKSIKNGNIETSCHWGVELHCSGYLEEVWDKLILLSSQVVNIAVPKITSYIFNRFQNFLEIVGDCPNSEILLSIRNNQTIRYQLCEVICLLSTSQKRELNKIANIKPYELDLNWVRSNKRLIENNLTTPSFIKTGDSSNIHIILYQFHQYLTYSKKDVHNAIYWMSWLFEWDNKYKNNPNYTIESRKIKSLDAKYQKDIVWVLWEIIISETNNRNQEYISTQIQALYQLYKFNYSTGKRRSRLPLMIHAITLLSLNVDWNTQLTDKQDIIKQVCVQINKLYIDIKQNQVFIDNYGLVHQQNTSTSFTTNDVSNKVQPLELKNLSDDTSKKKNKKNQLSLDSQKKLDAFNRISNKMMYS